MIILPEQDAVFVAIPRTGSKAMSLWLERAFRSEGGAGSTLYPAEALHDWHATLSEAVDVSNYPLFRMWSFAVVRNPFDRLVSWAAMSDPDFAFDPRGALLRLLEAEPTRWTLPQVYFTDGVTQVYRFERLPEAVADLRERLGVPDDVLFTAEHETEHEQYRVYYDKELRELVAARYADDLAAFNYRF